MHYKLRDKSCNPLSGPFPLVAVLVVAFSFVTITLIVMICLILFRKRFPSCSESKGKKQVRKYTKTRANVSLTLSSFCVIKIVTNSLADGVVFLGSSHDE